MLKQCLLCIAILSASTAGFAEQISRLYTSQVTINNQSNASLQSAFQQGLLQVLTKVSGNPNISTLPKINNQLNQAKSLVQSFNVSSNPNSPPALQITIQYDKTGIIKILNNSGQAIWGSERPLTLIWLTDENNTVMTSSDTSADKKEVDTIANARGLPIIFPLMDLEDQAIDQSNTLSPQQTQALLKRYHADAILIGQVTNQKTQSQISWQFIYNQQPTTWQSQSNSSKSAIDAGINQISTMLANQFSVIQSSNLQSNYTIAVNNIGNLADYGKLIQSIKNNNLIHQYEIKDMNNNDVVISITSSANLDTLNQSLLKSEQLTSDANTNNQPDTLSYHWTSPTNTIVINNNGTKKNDSTVSSQH